MSQSGLGRSDFGTNGVAPAGGSDGASLPDRTGGRVPSPDLAGPTGPTRTTRAGADAASGFGDFIVDTTSAEQVALEGRLLAGRPVASEESGGPGGSGGGGYRGQSARQDAGHSSGSGHESNGEGQTRNGENGQARRQQPVLARNGAAELTGVQSPRPGSRDSPTDPSGPAREADVKNRQAAATGLENGSETGPSLDEAEPAHEPLKDW